MLTEDARQREHSLRDAFNGLRYILKTGAPWRWMPNDLPPWAAVYQQAQRWLAAGCFEALAEQSFCRASPFCSAPGTRPAMPRSRSCGGERTIAFLGVLLHSQQVQFAEPEVSISNNWNKEQSAASQRAALEDAARGSWWIALCHVSFPGVGHFRQADRGFDWYPAMFGQGG